MFQRFTVVMEFQNKPVLPPPFIIFCHVYSMLKLIVRKAKGLQEIRDNGLKLFLEKDDLERLYDFEEECVEGYFHEQNEILLQSTDQRIKNTDERVENMSQKIEDINQKENIQSISVQNMEFRLRKMEESTEQILNHLAVIHRFMSTHINPNSEHIQGSVANIVVNPPMIEQRFRTMSESDTGPTYQHTTHKRKFNRSLTEVRPDAYIFDDGSHFEVRTVIEENEIIQSSEDMNELTMTLKSRKLSVQSEEPEFIDTPPQQQTPGIQIPIVQLPPIPRSDSQSKKITITRQDTKETQSTESKDTLTPLENCDEKTIVGLNEDVSSEVFNSEGLRQRMLRRRNSILGRRNSESCSNYDINKSQQSLNMVGQCRRQFSLTQSEPDSDGPISSSKPIPMKPNKHHMMLHLHTEYTSITDELETVYHMMASPTTSIMEEKPRDLNELSTPEFAALIEKQHLKECEDNDYLIMEGLLQTRGSLDDSDDNDMDNDYGPKRMLRRETAIELPITPSKLAKKEEPPKEEGDFHVQNERQPLSRNISADAKNCSPISISNQNSPRNSAFLSSTYLNPPSDPVPKFHIKSNESLQKNSSSDTEYSMQPYKVIKQSSNDTNSSFNIDNSSITNDLSMDGDSALNATVIENTGDERGMPKRAATMGSSESRPAFLRKQFSMDHSGKRYEGRPVSDHFESRPGFKPADIMASQPSPPILQSPIPPTPCTPVQVVGLPPKIPSNSRLQMTLLKDSSSTSTEETKDDRTVSLVPSISTHVVQDEIAKLSSNIKNSTEDESGGGLPFNETMC